MVWPKTSSIGPSEIQDGVAAEQVGPNYGAEGGVPREKGTLLHFPGRVLLPAYWVKGNPCRTSALPMEMKGCSR